MLALFLVTVAGCGQQTAPAPAPAPKPSEPAAPTAEGKYGGTIRVAHLRDLVIWDPHVSGGASHAWLLNNIFDTLIEYNLKGELVGALAERWEQPDANTYVFHLRKGVKFHDGSDFTAKDVVASIERMRNPEVAATMRTTMENVSKIEILDDHTVKLTLANPQATFLSMLTSYTTHILSEKDVNKPYSSPDNFNGTGPFILASWEPEREYVIKRNDNYWKEGLPYLDEVRHVIITNEKARMDALRSGEVDITSGVPWQDDAAFEAEGFVMYRHYGLMSYIRLNQNRPPLDDKRVRQALALILDRQEINDLAFGGLAITHMGPLQPPGSPYYFEDLEGAHAKDLDKARELLKQAGFATPADVPPLEFSCTTSALSAQPGKVVQQQWEEFGLRVVWKTIDVPTLTKNRAEGTYVVHQDGGGMAVPDPDYLRIYFHSMHGSTHAVGVKYKNERLDELLDLASQTTDEAKRKAYYREAEEIILDEVPMIWLLWRHNGEAAATYVKGYDTLPSAMASQANLGRFEYVWLDK